jgi:hypothetical protein
MSYYEDLLKKRGLKLTEEQVSIRNAWFVSQNDRTRRFKPLAKQKGDKAPVSKQADQQELTRQVRRLFH